MADTIEWFGATTFRLKAAGLTIFLDTWLDRPKNLKQFLSINDVTDCDYICISHAHFDHLPGADRIAKATGAIIIGNGEAISVMRKAGVPDDQLMQVSGGERIPLYTKQVRDAACAQRSKRPFGPPQPDPADASLTLHVWPSCHCLMPGKPGEHPDKLDTGKEYFDSSPFACTLDITNGMKHGLLSLAELPADALSTMPSHMQTFAEYLRDPLNHYSAFDGGQLMYNFLIGGKTVLFMSHLGGYRGILEALHPKPDVAILGIAGRGNIDGRPFDGSAAQCATNIVRWLGEPSKIIWCLHDEAPIGPFSVDTTAATQMVEAETRSKIWTLEHGKIAGV